MFKFLKEKLKGALSAFSKKVEAPKDEDLAAIVPEAPHVEEQPHAHIEPEQLPVTPLPVEAQPPAHVELPPAHAETEPPAVPEHVEEAPVQPVQAPAPAPHIRVESHEKEPAPVPALRPVPETKPHVPHVQTPAPAKPEVARLEKIKPSVEATPVVQPARPVELTKERVPELAGKQADKATSEPELTKEPVTAPPKKGFFARLKEAVVTTKISEKDFNELFWELELAMLENNVAVEAIDSVKADLREKLVDKPIARGKVEATVKKELGSAVAGLFAVEHIDLLQKTAAKKPLVIAFVGVNGSGKTTSIAKVARYFQDHNKNVVVAAADTFRAAAIDQLELHCKNLGVKLIKHDYGSDPAAVAFDAIKHAQAAGKDVVLIDTAGRLHSNTNLMDEMKKIVRVAKPDITLFVGEAIAGNDCIEQARMFSSAVNIDGIVLAKADIDEKGGAALSVTHVTGKPIVFLGVGQDYGDLKQFDANEFIRQLGLEA